MYKIESRNKDSITPQWEWDDERGDYKSAVLKALESQLEYLIFEHRVVDSGGNTLAHFAARIGMGDL